MIQNKDHFREFMEDNVEIDEYIFKILLDGELDGHAEFEAFSELYNTQIQVFDSLRSRETITRISLLKENMIIMLFLEIIKIV